MLRYIACAATAFIFLAPAQAAVQTYDWTFTGGFRNVENGYSYDTRLQGRFTVDDLNADGKFDRSEVQSLSYRGYDYSTCTGCAINRFSWVPGSAPEFDIGWERTYDWGYASEYVRTGEYFGSYSYAYGGGEPYDFGAAWSPDVTWKVSAVPEPQTWLMLGAGLMAIGAAVRRRKPV